MAAWRLHVFTDVEGVPGAAGPGTVAVLQISHALGGGGRTSAPAAIMFGRRDGVVPGIDAPPHRGSSTCRSWGFVQPVRIARWSKTPTQEGFRRRPICARCCGPMRDRRARGTCGPWCGRRSDLSGPTVTVAALSAVSVALAEHLRSLGDDPSCLGAEVPMAKPPPRLAYNHFGNVGVGLYPELAEPERWRGSPPTSTRGAAERRTLRCAWRTWRSPRHPHRCCVGGWTDSIPMSE